MKLFFSKNDRDEIIVKMSTSTVQQEFSYVEMIKNLLENNVFDDTDFTDEFSDEEIDRIESMLTKINDSIATEDSGIGKEVNENISD